MREILVLAAAVSAVACAEPTAAVRGPQLRLDANASGLNMAAIGPVVPGGFLNLMGAANNSFPHAVRNLRYQQVFLGSEVAAPVIIGLCLRRDEVGGGTERVQTLSVKMGPTAVDHTTLGRVFADNYSAPPTDVFAGDIVVPAGVAGGTPADFDLCIPFLTEYLHPAGSNLIVEVVNTSIASANVPKDACVPAQPGCTTARAYAFSPTATTAFSVEGGGLVMRFLVPESPAPTDPVVKEECMKGGWASFGFRNQGQCVRFTETGGDSR